MRYLHVLFLWAAVSLDAVRASDAAVDAAVEAVVEAAVDAEAAAADLAAAHVAASTVPVVTSADADRVVPAGDVTAAEVEAEAVAEFGADPAALVAAAEEELLAAEEEEEGEVLSLDDGAPAAAAPPAAVGPPSALAALLGPELLALEMVDEKNARIASRDTDAALRGKKVIGLYFSADWCGPCVQFTPELVAFYDRINARRGRAKDTFEIVWVSRCRDQQSYVNYFAQMNWLALPPEEAAGERGQALAARYKVQGIPSFVLLDEEGGVLTTNARQLIPQDRGGVGFPWKSPLHVLYHALVPRTIRKGIRDKLNGAMQAMQKPKGRQTASATA